MAVHPVYSVQNATGQCVMERFLSATMWRLQAPRYRLEVTYCIKHIRTQEGE